MTLKEFLTALTKKKRVFVFALIVFVLAAILITVARPLKYGSSFKLLTVHNFSESTDPYLASKSNEYLSSLLARIIYTNSFFEKIKDSGLINKDYFNGNDKKQIKKWENTVRAKSVADTGIIAIDIYHTDRDQAERIAQAVSYILRNDHANYHGFGKNVEIKVIDKPITSTYPVKPNIILNLILAIIFSIIFSLSYIYLFPEVKEKKKKDDNWEKISDVINNNQKYEKIANNLKYKEDVDENNYEENFQDNGDMNNILKR